MKRCIIVDLFATLLRLRSHFIALVADIKKAFLDIDIHNDGRDALKLFCKDDPSNQNY